MSNEKKEKKQPATNFDKVKKKLCPKAVDAAYLFNTCLQNRTKRSEAGLKALKDASPCAFCWKHHVKPAQSEDSCTAFRCPVGLCHANILRWLELPAGKPAPKEWLKEA